MRTLILPPRFLLLAMLLFLLACLVPFLVLARDLRIAHTWAPRLPGDWVATFTQTIPYDSAPPDTFETVARIGIDSSQLFDPVRGSLRDDFVQWLFSRDAELLSSSYFPRRGVERPTQVVQGRPIGPDSLELAINPFMSHGVVMIRGEHRDDRFEGTWFMVTDWHPVAGVFTWRRRPR